MALMMVYLINQDGTLLGAMLGTVDSDTFKSDDVQSLGLSLGLLLVP